MSNKIEWLNHPDYTGESWNPVTGCRKISEGCRNCYAETMHKRLRAMGQLKYKYEFTDVRHHPVELERPLGWTRKPRLIFPCSMSDLFSQAVPDRFIFSVLNTVVRCDSEYFWNGSCNHQFLFLTKRAERMRHLVGEYIKICRDNPGGGRTLEALFRRAWFGITAENQRTFDARIEELSKLDVPRKFISFEPLIGAIVPHSLEQLSWMFIGAETDYKNRNRECKLHWVRKLIYGADNKTIQVPVFIKKIAYPQGARVNGDIADWPQIYQRREYPESLNINGGKVDGGN